MDKLKKVTQDIKRHLLFLLMLKLIDLKDLNFWISKSLIIKVKHILINKTKILNKKGQ